MSNGGPEAGDRDYLGKALDIAIRLAVVAFIVLAAFRIVSPFLVAVVWAIVIAVALYPIFVKLTAALGGRRKLAGGIFIVVSLAILIVPAILVTDSIVGGARDLITAAETGTLQVPPPTEKVKNWPMIGKRTYVLWQSAHEDVAGTVESLKPQLKALGRRIAAGVTGLGVALIQTIFALIIAGILMMVSQGADKTANQVAVRLAGPVDGPAIVRISVDTIRSVVKGVLLVSLIQGTMAAIGLKIAGVPAVGLWAILVTAVAVVQLPPILILGPIIPWVFAHNDSTGIAIFFTIWSLIVSGADGVLKPIFLGRGVQVPMLVILIGAIGGVMRSGVVGLFIGPVFLAIAYMIFVAWVSPDEAPHKVTRSPESADA